MKLEWYMFDQSYLLDLVNNPLGYSLTFSIDAKITFDHPKFNVIGNADSKSEKIIINPNEDFGSIEQLQLKSPHSEVQMVLGLSSDERGQEHSSIADLIIILTELGRKG